MPDEQIYKWTDPQTKKRYKVRYTGEVPPDDDTIRQSLGLGEVKSKTYRDPDTGKYLTVKYKGDVPPTGEAVFKKNNTENKGVGAFVRGAKNVIGDMVRGAAGGGYAPARDGAANLPGVRFRDPASAVKRPFPTVWRDGQEFATNQADAVKLTALQEQEKRNQSADYPGNPDALNYVLYPAVKPVADAAGYVGNASRNFAQGVTASRMQRRENDTPSTSVTRNVLSLLAPGNPIQELQDTGAGLSAVWHNDGDKRIGKLVPELAPNTVPGMAYNTLTALGSDPLNFIGEGVPGALESAAKVANRTATGRRIVSAVETAARVAGKLTKPGETAGTVPEVAAANDALAALPEAQPVPIKSPSAKPDELLFKIGDDFNGGKIESMDTSAGTVNVKYPDNTAETIAVRMAGPDANTPADLATLTEQSAGNVNPYEIEPAEPPVSSPEPVVTPAPISEVNPARPIKPAPLAQPTPRKAGQTSFKRTTPEPVIPNNAEPLPVPMSETVAAAQPVQPVQKVETAAPTAPGSPTGTVAPPVAKFAVTPAPTAPASRFGEVPAEYADLFRPAKDFGNHPLVKGTTGAMRAAGNAVLDAYDTTNGVMKAFLLGGDGSAPLRQGGKLLPSNLPAAGRALVEQTRAYWSPERFTQQIRAIAARPNAKLYSDAGLYVPDAVSAAKGGSDLLRREEQFASKLAEQVPLAGAAVQAGDRAMTGYLTRFRADVFDAKAAELAKRGITPETNPEEYRALAEFINTATGRGDLGGLAKHEKALGRVFLAPRNQMAHLQLLNPVTYYKMPAATRRIALQAIGAHLATNAALLGMVKAAKKANPDFPVDVEFDPRSSAFGTIQIGKSRLDLLGAGETPWLRFFTRMATAQKKDSTGKVRFASPLETGGKRGEALLNPAASLALDLARGTDYNGNTVKPGDAVMKRFIPLLYQDTQAAMKANGTGLGLALGAAASHGAGVQTIEPKPKRDHSYTDRSLTN